MSKKNINVYVCRKKEVWYIYINNRLFFSQSLLVSENKHINDYLYTYFYILKILNRFGLIAPCNKFFGYKK